ncbi:hypothetical protein K432DRAFT_344880 [Lepidopterella palustris CBS 459.81]|uniref:Transcription factor CBF/NF-Y/archaeal histone domain-containing protein n=1 Tax=Lepidopterella palustris CBS 459.81 TaxID=1314670 RepID=A0A8E2EIV1_9PEZI|nr:hypothetical protein K432DRAFT_344880 [Lepidopterella palustris CBS 459.81]
MAPAQSLYPRSTLKRIIKAHSNKALAKNTDIMIFLDYTLFLQDLLREASIRSKQSGERGISARSIRRVRDMSLRKFKG